MLLHFRKNWGTSKARQAGSKARDSRVRKCGGGAPWTSLGRGTAGQPAAGGALRSRLGLAWPG